MKMGALNAINDIEHAFLLISPSYTSSYHFSSYLAHWPNIYLGLDHKLFYYIWTHFLLLLCNVFLLMHRCEGQCASRKIWWKVVAARIWWWDEFKWQKSAPNVIKGVGLWWKILLLQVFRTHHSSGWTPLMGGHPIRE